ncbi:MAG: EamA family transporter RarD [Alphaproteobacteria bacterium]|jgi:chloramphenicol-sensitive protein RarD|uniref:EamA family transporter RarD n=1 Tax=Devosia sp. XGJD_8 TaxID=3391187 RepID=UPI001DDB166E|nr:EamA family transporter RarD [Alphaproteobacteria bacterium]MBU1559915.1 EamA family transporter RarD [Alphaproteobacteria bacterium]MBU2302217.1 EamA family transporter RarD [Alphaproteobacteria bacterium]MBU2369483.1 EamA family transporter RarD [Alphaproteobacteria bacterium]
MSLPESAPEAIAPPAVAAPSQLASTDTRNGVLAALAAYLLWGFLPLLFKQVEAAGSVLIVAERTVWSLVLLAVILRFSGGFGDVRALLADRKRALGTLLSAVLLAGNWLLYVWAVETGQVLEASFGYFINPLVNVLMGMILLGERQNRLQTVSILMAAVAIAIQAIALGTIPFIALGLALSFGFYGYFRKTAQLGPASGLFAETAMLTPAALAFVGYSLITTGPGIHADPYLMTWMVLTGPATAIPLLLFAFAVRRLRLTTIGMFQYLAPSIQFLLAILVFGEHLDGLRLLSFALIWVSLLVFSYDSFRRRGRAATA